MLVRFEVGCGALRSDFQRAEQGYDESEAGASLIVVKRPCLVGRRVDCPLEPLPGRIEPLGGVMRRRLRPRPSARAPQET